VLYFLIFFAFLFEVSAASFNVKTQSAHSYKKFGGTRDYVVQWGHVKDMPKDQEILKLEGKNWKVLLPIFHSKEDFAWQQLKSDDPDRERVKKVEKYELLCAVSFMLDSFMALRTSHVFCVKRALFSRLRQIDNDK